MIAFDAQLNAELDDGQAAHGPRPGEVTDPVMADALAKAKALHQQQFGVRVA